MNELFGTKLDAWLGETPSITPGRSNRCHMEVKDRRHYYLHQPHQKYLKEMGLRLAVSYRRVSHSNYLGARIFLYG